MPRRTGAKFGVGAARRSRPPGPAARSLPPSANLHADGGSTRHALQRLDDVAR